MIEKPPRRYGLVGCRPWAITPVVWMLMVGLSGCGNEPKTFPVRGLVRFPDGKPLREGSIEFESSGKKGQPVTARGQIAPDGSFVLGTYDLDDGAVEGVHRAVVISDYDIGNGVERPDLLQPTRLHPKHRDFSSSGLKYTVLPEENEFIVEVEYEPVSEPEPDS